MRGLHHPGGDLESNPECRTGSDGDPFRGQIEPALELERSRCARPGSR